MYFCYFTIISPWKRAGSFIWTNLNPLHPGCFVPSLVEIDTVVLEKKMKMWKVYNNDNNNIDRQQTNLIRKAHLSLRLRWAKNILLPILNLKHRKTSYKSITVLVFFNYLPVNIFTNFANIIWCKDVWFTICLVEYWYFFGKNFLVSVVYLKW